MTLDVWWLVGSSVVGLWGGRGHHGLVNDGFTEANLISVSVGRWTDNISLRPRVNIDKYGPQSLIIMSWVVGRRCLEPTQSTCRIKWASIIVVGGWWFSFGKSRFGSLCGLDSDQHKRNKEVETVVF